ncbi:MAG: lysoplasmalogenase [Saprospiraceae bacterium]|nr:lysoplasmalogenase [Saprospiraceae bacterium]
MPKKPAAILFWIVSIIHLLAILLSIDSLRYLSKPLIMLSLGLFYVLESREQSPSFRLLVGFAILFSLAGDLFLLALEFPDNPVYLFLLGLGSFLFAHIFYLLAFRKLGGKFLNRKPGWFIPVLTYLFFFLLFLWPDLPLDLKIPVSVYGLTICLMALSAIHFSAGQPAAVRRSLILGAGLFILSDSLIAIGKFSLFQNFSFGIMLTYILAQWLIINGLRKTTY